MVFLKQTYFISNFCDVVEPDYVKNKEDTEETVEDIVDREHLDKLEGINGVYCCILFTLYLCSFYGG